MCGWRRTSTPKISASPPSIGSRVASIRSIVVLPAPLGPSTPKTSPRRTSRSTSSTARWSPKALTRPVARDGQVGVGQVGVRQLCHGAKRGAARFHAAFTPVSGVAILVRDRGSVRSPGADSRSVDVRRAGRPRLHRDARCRRRGATARRRALRRGPSTTASGVGARVGDDADVVLVVGLRRRRGRCRRTCRAAPRPRRRCRCSRPDVVGEPAERAPRRAPAVHDVEALVARRRRRASRSSGVTSPAVCSASSRWISASCAWRRKVNPTVCSVGPRPGRLGRVGALELGDQARRSTRRRRRAARRRRPGRSGPGSSVGGRRRSASGSWCPRTTAPRRGARAGRRRPSRGRPGPGPSGRSRPAPRGSGVTRTRMCSR